MALLIAVFFMSETLFGGGVEFGLIRAAPGSVLDALRHTAGFTAVSAMILYGRTSREASIKSVFRERWRTVAVWLAVGILLALAVMGLVVGKPTFAAVFAGNGLLLFIGLRGVLTTHSGSMRP
jgi:hypothetical protein